MAADVASSGRVGEDDVVRVGDERHDRRDLIALDRGIEPLNQGGCAGRGQGRRCSPENRKREAADLIRSTLIL